MGCYLKHLAGEGEAHKPGTTITLLPAKGREATKRHLEQRRRFMERRSVVTDDD